MEARATRCRRGTRTHDRARQRAYDEDVRHRLEASKNTPVRWPSHPRRGGTSGEGEGRWSREKQFWEAPFDSSKSRASFRALVSLRQNAVVDPSRSPHRGRPRSWIPRHGRHGRSLPECGGLPAENQPGRGIGLRATRERGRYVRPNRCAKSLRPILRHLFAKSATSRVSGPVPLQACYVLPTATHPVLIFTAIVTPPLQAKS